VQERRQAAGAVPSPPVTSLPSKLKLILLGIYYRRFKKQKSFIVSLKIGTPSQKHLFLLMQLEVVYGKEIKTQF